jgi:hypothetical protein
MAISGLMNCQPRDFERWAATLIRGCQFISHARAPIV